MEASEFPSDEGIPHVGDVAPSFALPGPDGEIRLQSDDAAPLTVLTFLQDTIADNALSLIGIIESVKSSVGELSARYICVLTEPVPALDTFREEFEITLELASDFDRVATKAYGLLSDKQGAFTSVPRESVFVLDKELRVVYRWVSETKEELPVQEEIEDAVRRLAG